MLIWSLKVGVDKIVWGLKFQDPKHALLGSEIKGKEDYLVSQNMFYLKNIYLQFNKVLDAHKNPAQGYLIFLFPQIFCSV